MKKFLLLAVTFLVMVVLAHHYPHTTTLSHQEDMERDAWDEEYVRWHEAQEQERENPAVVLEDDR
jgi:hypothetical protein